MPAKQHLVVALDHSVNSAPAARGAAWLCRALGATATLVYVVEPPSSTLLEPIDDRLRLSQVEWGEEQLADTARTVFEGIEVDTKLIDSGQPVAEAVCYVALGTSASLIVMGTHGRSAIEQAIFGSTAANVVRHAPCDVLTVRARGRDGDVDTPDDEERSWVAGGVGAIRHIVCGVDFSPCSELALKRAAALSDSFGAELHVVHAMRMPFWPMQESEGAIVEPFTKKAQEALAELLERVGKKGAHRDVAEGEPGKRVLELADQVDADMIVVGTHGRTGLKRWAIGSVAERVVRASLIPVWCVRI